MDEIDPVRGAALRQQGAGVGRQQRRPAHVGNGLAGPGWQGLHPSFHQAQATGCSLITAFKEQLQAQADAQQGAARRAGVPQGLHQIGGPQALHGRVKGAHSRQHQGLASVDGLGVPHGPNVGAEAFEGPLHRVQVAHAVVHQADGAFQGGPPTWTQRSAGCCRASQFSSSRPLRWSMN